MGASLNMSSRGRAETERLKTNLQEQLQRLLSQLEDLEEMKEDLDDDEYEITRNDTITQLKEFQASLKKMTAGNMTLVDELNGVQLAINAAITESFSPVILKMLAKNETSELRNHIEALKRDFSMNKMPEGAFQIQIVEALTAMEKMGSLAANDRELLRKYTSSTRKEFRKVKKDEIGKETEDSLKRVAGSQVRKAKG